MNKLARYRLLEKMAKIVIDVSVGDTILAGRFKNIKTVIKSIGKDDHGMPTINGRKAATFRIFKKKTKK